MCRSRRVSSQLAPGPSPAVKRLREVTNRPIAIGPRPVPRRVSSTPSTPAECVLDDSCDASASTLNSRSASAAPRLSSSGSEPATSSSRKAWRASGEQSSLGVCDHYRRTIRRVVRSVRHAPILTVRYCRCTPPPFAWQLTLGSRRQRQSKPPLSPSAAPVLASNATRVEQSDGWIAVKGFVELGRWGEVDGLVAELVVARESGGGRWCWSI
jgi:hypothetical protein